MLYRRFYRQLLCLVMMMVSPSLMAAAPTVVPPKLVRFAEAKLPPNTPVSPKTVGLVITIGTDGKVTSAIVKTRAGEPWDSAAQQAALRFIFTPATVKGKAVAVTVPFSYRFEVPSRRGPIESVRRYPRRTPERSPGYHYAGEILEKGTRTPLRGVTVLIRDPRLPGKLSLRETLTDERGIFSFDGLTFGRLKLQILAPGHRSRPYVVRSVPRPLGDAVSLQRKFYLRPDLLSRYRTVIVDKEKPGAAQEIVLTRDELTKMPGTQGDPTRVVQTLPGVSRSPFGFGYYIVRGASFENTGFFIDGHPALFLYHLLGGPGVIHPELIGRITFYPGGYPASYGRFATGVISVETKAPPTDRWHLDVEVDVLKAGVLFSTPFDDKKGQLTLAFRKSYYEVLLPAFAPDVSLSYLDYQMRLSYAFTPKLRFKLLTMGAEDSFGSQAGATSRSSDTAESDFSLGFHRVNAALEWDISSKLRWTNSVMWEYDHTSSFRTAEEDEDVKFGLKGWFMQWRSFFEWKPTTNFKFQAGLDTIYGTFDAALKVPILPPLGDPEPPVFNPITADFNLGGPLLSVAPYLLADWEIVKGLRLLPGFRANIDRYGGDVKMSVDPRLSIRWEFLKGLTVKAMGGMAHQPPPAFQVYEPIGDPSIPPVRGIQGSLGFEWKPTKAWEISIEGFYNHLSRIARPGSGLEASDGSLARNLWSADVLGRAYGLELMIRKRFGGRFYGWLSYTLSRAERLYPPDDWTLFGSDQTHILNLAASVKLGREWTLGGRFTLTSGNPYYPVIGARYDADRDRYTPLYASTESRLPFFHRLDIRLDKRWRYDTWMLEFYIDIQNVYNASNPEAKTYSFDYRQQGTGPSLPILPTLGLRAIF